METKAFTSNVFDKMIDILNYDLIELENPTLFLTVDKLSSGFRKNKFYKLLDSENSDKKYHYGVGVNRSHCPDIIFYDTKKPETINNISLEYTQVFEVSIPKDAVIYRSGGCYYTNAIIFKDLIKTISF
jgi:hypothetical protein